MKIKKTVRSKIKAKIRSFSYDSQRKLRTKYAVTSGWWARALFCLYSKHPRLPKYSQQFCNPSMFLGHRINILLQNTAD